MATILAIETSCDETAVAIVNKRKVLSSIVASQVDLHSIYGGVVPELASRQHLETINPCLKQAMAEAAVSWQELDAIAATCAPGLVGALLVGVSTAKTLAMVYDKPFLGIHHLEGHIYASYLSQPELQPPFICLLVSGGHTSMILVKDDFEYQMLGTTRDDAAGEAFDKVARLLDLGYPGGPIIDKLAESGNSQAFKLPQGRISLPEGGYHPYDSSFSGLKTAVLRLTQKLQTQGDIPVADIAASFQATVAKALTTRTIKCALDNRINVITVGGGVAANSELRKQLVNAAKSHNIQVYFPSLKFCTDNAAMIGCAASEHYERGDYSPLDLEVRSRMDITQVKQLYL
ncbi:MAG: tRNA (adenosine(37)-N6)-threonylcarbamoyltransferase complex transferase subunit TsaD [Xenococcaceae cyanobacterium MO_207.B15]|nr:tRNA (adenosine(37)-N6)-threonylcarbamoyltransferase complex transferase subunit TsaD [Xenococcaceae cyanobacterium MO_207.B15]MDJ0746349.1 tRNA (adenosine(37)-N6)-threonylcarbamoyltransferase complex transferase subunit TsaD [Xenococcaceae cyanobacterium MO_167.B27]